MNAPDSQDIKIITTVKMSYKDRPPARSIRDKAFVKSGGLNYPIFTDRERGTEPSKTKIRVEIDSLDRHELFLLEEGEKKVTQTNETRVPNAAIFDFKKEDHTLANVLRAKLARSEHVIFAAYQVPHPLFADFKLRVQTDGEITPKDAVTQACQDLIKELQILDQEFTKEFELKKIATAGGDF